ncbi:hypothetical protein IV500_05270 [Paeniglutamicibacter antarcticus]|uniref:Uncharacterized protein n=1 Tax=Arthrobacter terrae TaxID=2935737 RepID=A0A931CME4_9MICC|nr:hypothetical protein [Arthrobacter terrae]MBG0738830.1 hypothetical protein [Arthrobacter terrae]
MTENIVRQPTGIPAGGQFAASAHAEPVITLAPAFSYDPEAVAKGILSDLRDIQELWTSELFYDTYNAVRAGKTTYGKFLGGLIAKNRGGRCEHHEHDPGHSPERYCHDCHIAFMVEARTNPKPLPSPRGVIPGPPQHHHLTKQQISSDYNESNGVEQTTTAMTGDQKFEAAVRRMFKAPEDANVEIIQEEYESGTDWTRETSTEITVKCDGREAVYEYLGALMTALDQAEQDPEEMALRFMRATSGQRPLLNGVAAVYLKTGEHSAPKPVFGKIRNVFSGRDASMDFLHTDGRQEYVPMNRVASILETDQSSIYDESE